VQTVQLIATVWAIRRSNTGERKRLFTAPVHIGPASHSPSCTMDTAFLYPGNASVVQRLPHTLK